MVACGATVWLLKVMTFDQFKTTFGASPTQVAFIEATFADADDELRDEFATTVDESAFSPAQWVDALRMMGEWLDARSLKLDLRDRIGYVSCAADSAGPTGGMDHLPSLVEEMLARYGCERAEAT